MIFTLISYPNSFFFLCNLLIGYKFYLKQANVEKMHCANIYIYIKVGLIFKSEDCFEPILFIKYKNLQNSNIHAHSQKIMKFQKVTKEKKSAFL